MKSLFEVLGVIVGILIITAAVAAAIYFTPVFTIWSLNAVFSMALVVDVRTWFAVMWLTLQFGGIRLATAVKNITKP